jgi:hypothetical protein
LWKFQEASMVFCMPFVSPTCTRVAGACVAQATISQHEIFLLT